MKYSLQCKIGQMDGAFVAYHNTQKIFGFEYITLSEMEERIFGNKEFANLSFNYSMALLERILDHIISELGETPETETLKIGFFTNGRVNQTEIFVEYFPNGKPYMD